MTKTINALKKSLWMFFYISLAIILIPFALFFSLIRLPFAKRRINKLHDILINDWQPRKKYIYIGFTSGYPLSDYVKETIIAKYGKNIVWDEWDTTLNDWKESEPDNSQRVTTFWQDIGGDFDGDPMVIIAAYGPNDTVISRGHNFYQFLLQDNDDVVIYDDQEITLDKAQEKIQTIITDSLANWKASSKEPLQ